MIALKDVLAELKAEPSNDVVAQNGNNYCLLGAGNNYCLFGYSQPDASTPIETPSQTDDQVLLPSFYNRCLF
jgi:hypothetical protein